MGKATTSLGTVLPGRYASMSTVKSSLSLRRTENRLVLRKEYLFGDVQSFTSAASAFPSLSSSSPLLKFRSVTVISLADRITSILALYKPASCHSSHVKNLFPSQICVSSSLSQYLVSAKQRTFHAEPSHSYMPSWLREPSCSAEQRLYV